MRKTIVDGRQPFNLSAGVFAVYDPDGRKSVEASSIRGGNDKRRYVDSRDRNRALIVSLNCSTEILAGSGSAEAPRPVRFLLRVSRSA